MITLKLIKGVYYSYGNKFVATIDNPIVKVDKEDVEYLISTSYFELVEEPKQKVEAIEKPKRGKGKK